tara:strand:- start:1063 stop:1221 length:159 start_codon:yes stop_codon:yes gene_type:complete
MSCPHHEDMLQDLFDEEMAAMQKSGMASTMTPDALNEHCAWIARDRFEDLCM